MNTKFAHSNASISMGSLHFIPAVSVIITNYNGKYLLEACLKSLHNQSFKNMEIILVDNASEDNSKEYMKNLSADIKIISLAKNAGFAGANTTGLKHARGKYIITLNNDLELDKECIKNLFYAIEANPEVGIVATKMIIYGTDSIDSAGDSYSKGLKGFKRGEETHSEMFNKQEYVFGACAGAALYRRKMIEEIGFFDKDFFLIHEDTDINLRAQISGWKALFVPTAIVYHKVRSTIGHMSDISIYYSLRNSELVIIKNIPLLVFFICLPEFTARLIAEFIYFVVKHKKLNIFFKAKIDSIRLLWKMFNKRRNIIKNRKVSNKYILEMMTPVMQKEFLKIKLKKLLYG